MNKYLVIFLSFVLAVPFARADDVASVDMTKQMQIASLKREISDLEIQLNECQRKNKNWRTATWVGAAGTVATGTAAIIQGVKLHNLKKENASQPAQSKPADPKDNPDDKK